MFFYIIRKAASYYKTLLGDAEGEACEGPRNFFCTEDSIPDSASEYRKEMDASYCARGGCEVDYSGYGTYDAATDTFVLDGRLHDGTKELGNASTQAWANTDIRRRRQKADEYCIKSGCSQRMSEDIDTDWQNPNDPLDRCHVIRMDVE